LKKLEMAKDRQLYAGALKTIIGEKAADEYKSLILKYAERTACQYYTDLKRLEGRFLCTDLYEDVPICKHHLGAGLACLTDVGMRAMAVKVDDVVGVAGFIKPGDQVDVLTTSRQSGQGAKIILSQLRVLAIGSELERKEDEKKPSKVTVITLEVDPQQSEKLALASSGGGLRLALRNPEDKGQPQTGSGTCVIYEGTERKEVGC
jgi:pilus assembly protein CpaB